MSKSPDPTRDELFAEPLTQPELFTFSESVAGVFPDMINRSVPGYATVVAMTGCARGATCSPRLNNL
jgi:tRNA (cmo5U34)-methyltransferase